MKVITVRPPWAFWIADHLKTVETRRHDHFRGLVGERIAIHCGQRFDYAALGMAMPHRAFSSLIDSMMFRGAESYGRIVCTATVQAHILLGTRDSKPALCDAAGLYGLVLKDVRFVKDQRKLKGQLGIWEVDLQEAA